VKLQCHQFSNFCHWLSREELPNLIKSCELPVIVCGERKLIISGLCSVLRYIVETAQQDVESSDNCDIANCVKNLLGLRKNCLRACAEVSEWTLYTEVTLPLLVERILNNCDTTGFNPRAELIQLENQLAKPPVEPNWRRSQKQHLSKQPFNTAVAAENITKQGCGIRDRIDEVHEAREGLASESSVSDRYKNMTKKFDNLEFVDDAEEICERRFVEGSNVQLTDLVLFVSIQLVLSVNDVEQWCSRLPRIVSWYQRMVAVPNVSNAVNSAGLFEYQSVADNVVKGAISSTSSSATNTKTSLKSVQNESNFPCTSGGCINSASDSALTKAITDDQNCIQHTEKTKFRISQGLIDAGIAKATGMGLLLEVLPLGNGRCLQLPWEEYPKWVLPSGLGGVPDKRATRKLQQLENIAAAVKELVSTRPVSSEADVIVDFCSGGGHVGILLAYLFPRYKVSNIPLCLLPVGY